MPRGFMAVLGAAALEAYQDIQDQDQGKNQDQDQDQDLDSPLRPSSTSRDPGGTSAAGRGLRLTF